MIELRKIVTEALVGMVATATSTIPPTDQPLPDFIQAPIDRAIDRITACLPATPWQSPDTAPKTGQTFIANVGMPWAVVMMWNEAMDQFCWADIEGNLFEGKNDPAFVTEWMTPGDLLGWMPLPALPDREGVNNG